MKGKRGKWQNLQKNGKEGTRTRQGFGELKKKEQESAEASAD